MAELRKRPSVTRTPSYARSTTTRIPISFYFTRSARFTYVEGHVGPPLQGQHRDLGSIRLVITGCTQVSGRKRYTWTNSACFDNGSPQVIRLLRGRRARSGPCLSYYLETTDLPDELTGFWRGYPHSWSRSRRAGANCAVVVPAGPCYHIGLV